MKEMVELNFPRYDFKIKVEGEKNVIYDNCRKKFVPLTPEEWVRQNMVRFLVNEKHYPASLIANEIAVEINKMKKRCDTVIYDRNLKPFMIVEYKAPNVQITQKVFDQIATYNLKLNVPLLIVSNGREHYCCKIDYQQKRYFFYREIPDYLELGLDK
mgnify:FL=1|jgi:type I site-specific restriction endonuclease